MNTLRIMITALLVLGLSSVGAMADGWDTYGQRGEKAVLQDADFRATQLIGQGVRNDRGEDLGSVVDVLFAENGRVQYLILDQGGILGRDFLGRGIGEEYIAVPWKAVEMFPGKRPTMDISKEKLREAPTFNKTDWQRFDDLRWEQKVHTYYGVESPEMRPGQEIAERAAMDSFKAASLIGTPVRNPQGETLGRVEDLMLGEDRVNYLIVSYGGFLGLGKSLIPVPYRSISLTAERDAAIMEMSRNTLRSAPRLGPQGWSALENPEFKQMIHGYFE